MQAALVAVRPGPEGDCPSARLVAEALAARVPGALVPIEEALAPEVLTLVLAGGGGTPSFSLLDREGQVRLHRSLPAPAGTPERDCPALAETVALIVQRYLHELEIPASPPPPQPVARPARPRWDLGLGTVWRPGDQGAAAHELRAALGRRLGATGRVVIGVSGGLAGASSHDYGDGQGTLRRIPAGFWGAWRLGAGPGDLELGILAEAEVVVMHASAGQMTQEVVKPAVVLGAAAAFRLPLGDSLFVRVSTARAFTLLRYEFVARSGESAFATRFTYGTIAAEAGLSFW